MTNDNEKAITRSRRFLLERLFVFALLIALPLLLAALLSLFRNASPRTARYEVVSDKLNAPVRIVLISDLHRQSFGTANRLLIDCVAAEKPDLIAVAGDMIEKHYTEAEADALIGLIEELCELAPVYFSVGNHDFPAFYSPIKHASYEMVLGEKETELAARLRESGAELLEMDYIDTSINGQRLRIGGLYAFAYEHRRYKPEQKQQIRSFLESFCDTAAYKLMLSHRPESFTQGDAAELWSVDLVLSGHTHNGVIALPFGLGAIWANGELFPKYDRGLFELGRIKLVVSAGLDGYKGIIPRVFNPPELVLIKLLPE